MATVDSALKNKLLKLVGADVTKLKTTGELSDDEYNDQVELGLSFYGQPDISEEELDAALNALHPEARQEAIDEHLTMFMPATPGAQRIDPATGKPIDPETLKPKA